MPDQDDFKLFLPLVKVIDQPDGSCMVYTRGTQETTDDVGEIFDYASSVPEIQKWSADAYKRSNGLSFGNIRAMHSNIAAGKLTESPTFVDAEKAVDLAIKVVDLLEAQKCREGVYTGASIGGKYKRRWFDPQLNKYRYTADPREFSLVDAPAVPTATFKLVKTDGSEELRKAGLVIVPPSTTTPIAAVNPERDKVADGTVTDPRDQVASPEPNAIRTDHARENVEKEIPVVAGFAAPSVVEVTAQPINETAPQGQPIAKVDVAPETLEALKALTAALNSVAALQKLSDSEKAEIEDKLKKVGSRVGIARHEGEPLTPPKGYPTDAKDYGDPANWSWPYDTKDRTQSALSYFNGGKGKDKYSDREWAVLGRRIAKQASAQFGVSYQYKPAAKTIESPTGTGKDAKKMTELNKADFDDLITQLQAGIGILADQIAGDPSAARNAVMAMLNNRQTNEQSAPSSGSSSPGTAPDTSAENTLAQAAGATVTIPGSSSSGSSSSSSGSSSSTSSSVDKTGATVTAPGASSSSSDSYKTMMDKMDALTLSVAKLVDALSPKPAAAQKSAMPAGDLAALLKAQTDQVDPVLAALATGGNEALRKAAEIAGTPENPDVGAVYAKANAMALAEARKLFLGGMPGSMFPLPSFTPPGANA